MLKSCKKILKIDMNFEFNEIKKRINVPVCLCAILLKVSVNESDVGCTGKMFLVQR